MSTCVLRPSRAVERNRTPALIMRCWRRLSVTCICGTTSHCDLAPVVQVACARQSRPSATTAPEAPLREGLADARAPERLASRRARCRPAAPRRPEAGGIHRPASIWPNATNGSKTVTPLPRPALSLPVGSTTSPATLKIVPRSRLWNSTCLTATATSPRPRCHCLPSPLPAAAAARRSRTGCGRRAAARRGTRCRPWPGPSAIDVVSTASFSGNAFSVTSARGKFSSPRGQADLCRSRARMVEDPLQLAAPSAPRRRPASGGRTRGPARHRA